MFGVQGSWPLVGRKDEITSLLAALRNERFRGAILTGQAGIGKTSLAQHIARQAEDGFALVYVRGTTGAAGMPYGALNFVLSELSDDAVANPLLLLRRLQTLFSVRNDGRQTLMLVDNAEALDGSSAMAIAHLARINAVKVLVVCQSLSAAPEEFCDLWKDGLLKRVDLEPLDLSATAELLTAGLGGPVARAVVVDMWHASGGNPLFLQATSREQRDSGYLVKQDGIWVNGSEKSPEVGRSLTEWIIERLSRLPPPQRAAAEIVSIMGALPLEMLADFVDSDSIDSLLESGLIEVNHALSPVVRFANSLVGDVIGQQMAGAPKPELLTTLAASILSRPMPAISRIRYAHWCLENGIKIAPEAALEAARLANRHFDSAGAQRFLQTVPTAARSADFAIEEAWAYGVQGKITRSVAILDREIEVGHEHHDLDNWVKVRLLRCRLLTRLHERYTEVDDLIAEVRQRVNAELVKGTQGATDLLLETELLAAELNAYNGKYQDILAPVNDLLKKHSTMQPTMRHELCSWLAEALCITGHQDEAIRVCQSVVSHLADDTDDPLVAEAAQARMFSVLLVSGNWSQCESILHHHDEQSIAGKYDGSSSELAEGCLNAYAGRGAEALTKLLPAVSQLRISDRHQLRVLAEAATAYAFTLVGDLQAALGHLKHVDLDGHRLDWRTLRATQYFAALASTATRDDLEVAHDMLSMADEDRQQGNRGHELFFLCQAVQLGLTEVADRLATTGRDGQGVFARTCAFYGKGVASGDSDQLLKAARSAADSGNYRLAHDAAELARTLSHGAGDDEVSTDTGSIFAAIGQLGAEARQRLLDQLTERERTIALEVANGASNRDIAEAHTVSVRTVEAHMHQVYAKLEVRNRQQLRAILG
ncbi:helix-turn-helix transcriptional regulator [Arthrobacter sp. Sr33]|uniref:helix-turn-helix transcriptional regulator n=1 Tax=Arthrobacter sp. TB 23 TaxID=494419 RepID=UPI00030F14AB|nr:LuxR family transcriptional regulator [Arthrobacter sp. TB 23]